MSLGTNLQGPSSQQLMQQAAIGAEDKYALTGWKRKTDTTFDLPLPSGQTCLVKKLDVPDIIRMGLLEQLDTFTPQLIAEPGGEAKPSNDIDFLKKLADPEKFDKFEASLDKAVVASVVVPKVYEVPPSPAERVEDHLYVDEIDFFDKMAIFTAVFDGMSNMSDFREEQAPGVAPVEDVQESGSPTE